MRSPCYAKDCRADFRAATRPARKASQMRRHCARRPARGDRGVPTRLDGKGFILWRRAYEEDQRYLVYFFPMPFLTALPPSFDFALISAP